MNPQELDALQALCKAATPGPWGSDTECARVYQDIGDGLILAIEIESIADCDFIAVARTAMPELIAEVRRLHERCEAAERDLELHGGCPSCAAQTGGGRVPCGFFALDTSVPRARCRNYSWRGPQPAKEANQ